METVARTPRSLQVVLRTYQRGTRKNALSTAHTHHDGECIKGPSLQKPSWPAALGLSYKQHRMRTHRDLFCGGKVGFHLKLAEPKGKKKS